MLKCYMKKSHGLRLLYSVIHPLEFKSTLYTSYHEEYSELDVLPLASAILDLYVSPSIGGKEQLEV